MSDISSLVEHEPHMQASEDGGAAGDAADPAPAGVALAQIRRCGTRSPSSLTLTPNPTLIEGAAVGAHLKMQVLTLEMPTVSMQTPFNM